MGLLETISKKAVTFKAFSQSLVDGDFVKIDGLKDNTVLPDPLALGLKNQIAQMEKELGKLISYEPFGIGEGKDELVTIYQFQAYLVFERGAYKPYLVVINAAEEEKKIIGFNIF